MAKIWKSSGMNKLIIVFLIFAFVITAAFAVTAGGTSEAAFAAPGDLNYKNVGETALATTYKGGAGIINGSTGFDGVNDAAGDDFSFFDLQLFAGASNTINFDNSGIKFLYQGGGSTALEKIQFTSKKGIENNSPLHYAMKNSNMYDVRAQLILSTNNATDPSANKDTNADNFLATIDWNNGVVIKNVLKQTVNNGAANVSASSEPLTISDTGNPWLEVKFSAFTGGTGSQYVYAHITSVKIVFIVTLKDNSSIRSNLITTITGDNRQELTLDSSAMQERRYVKSGDKLKVDVKLTDRDGNKIALGAYYKSIICGGVDQAVEWKAVVKRGADEVMQISLGSILAIEDAVEQYYLLEIPYGISQYENYELDITPSLRVDSSDASRKLESLAAQDHVIKLRIDNSTPEEPNILANSEFMTYIANASKDLTKRLFHTAQTLGISVSGINTGVGARESIYYTVNKTNTTSGTIVPDANSPQINSDKGSIRFEEAGQYAIAIVIIDEAGNKSRVYSSESVLFLVDFASYQVSAKARLGRNGSLTDANTSSDYGNFNFLVNGTNYNVSTQNYKRGAEVQMVFSFPTDQRKKYHLTNVYNNETEAYFNLMEPGNRIVVEQRGTTLYYTFKFVIDDVGGIDFVTVQNSRNFVFEFKYRVSAVLKGGNSRTFALLDPSSLTPIPIPQTLDINGFTYVDKNGNSQTVDIGDSYSISYGKILDNGDVQFVEGSFAYAGNYRYRILINYDQYYCEEVGDFIIKKADPGVQNFTVIGENLENVKRPSIEFGTMGGLGAFKLGSNDTDGAFSDSITSIGLRGHFEITNYNAAGDNYLNPDVGTKELKIRFVPTAFSEDYPIRNADNYGEFTISVTVDVVKRDLAVRNFMQFSNASKVVYDQNTNYVGQLNMELLAAFGINSADIRFSYRVDSGSFSETAPKDVGLYEVQAEIKDYILSYSGKISMKFEIVKRELTVKPDDESQSFQYDYGYFSRPSVKAYLLVDGILSPQNFTSDTFKYFYKEKNAADETFSAVAPANAGEYVLKVEIQHLNYRGIWKKDFVIKKVGGASSNITFNNPSIQSAHDGARLRYGMPLADLVLQLGSVTYRLSNGQIITLKGTIEPRVEMNGAKGKYYVPTADELRSTGGEFVFIYVFVPEPGSDSERNFEEIGRSAKVIVSPAILNFDQIHFLPQQYGQSLADLLKTMQGKPTYSHYNSDTNIREMREVSTGLFGYTGNLALTQILPVGDYETILRYQPAAEDIQLFSKKENLKLPLKVIHNLQSLKVENEDGAVTEFVREYGTKDSIPLKWIKSNNESLKLDYGFRYYKSLVNGKLTDEITDIVWQGVGQYYLQIYIVDVNYQGTVVLNYTIVKNNLYVTENSNTAYFPNQSLGKLEWGVSTFAFQLAEGNKMQGYLYRDDVTDFLKARVFGTFSFVEDLTFVAPNQNGVRVKLKFTPGMENEIDLSLLYEGCEFEFTVVVNKRTVTFEYDRDTTYSAQTQIPVVTVKDGLHVLQNVEYNLFFEGNTLPLNAGIYRGTVSINENSELYRGNGAVVYEILQQQLTVNFNMNDPVANPYYAGTRFEPSLVYKAAEGEIAGVVSENNIVYTYYNYLGESFADAPSSIGAYRVSVAIDGNHKGVAEAAFSLIPVTVTVQINELFYQEDYEVVSEIQPIRTAPYQFTLEYMISESQNWQTALPKDSGHYSVRLNLNENGYQNTYIFNNRIIINKLKVEDIQANGDLEFMYSVLAPELSFIAYGLGEETEKELNYRLRYFDSEGTEHMLPPSHMGEYRVSVILDERNYIGETEFQYYIDPGMDLKNNGNIETVSVQYKTEPQDHNDLFAQNGKGVFSYLGYAVKGDLKIITPNFISFGVGIYDVTFTFTATSCVIDGIEYKISEEDIDQYYAITKITITKKVLTENDFLVTAPQEQDGALVSVYDETAKTVSLKAKSLFFSAKERTDVQNNLQITYRKDGDSVATKEKPVAAGEYTVSIFVKHESYLGSMQKRLTIKRATPKVFLPTYVLKKNIGDSVTAGETINPITGDSTSGGTIYAHFNDSTRKIAGVFTIRTGKTFNAVNLQEIELIFTPSDDLNVETIEGLKAMAMIAADASHQYQLGAWFEEIAIATYGTRLTSDQLRIKTGLIDTIKKENDKTYIKMSDGSWIFGNLTLENETTVYEPGLSTTMAHFMPDAVTFPTYPIASVGITVRVDSAATVRINGTITAVVKVGSQYANAKFMADISVLNADYFGVTPEARFRFIQTADFDPLSAVVQGGIFPNAKVVFDGGNRFSAEQDEYDVTFVYELTESNIIAKRLSYEFHNNPSEAISLNGSNAAYLKLSEYMSFTFIGAGLPNYNLVVKSINGSALTNDPSYGELLYEVGRYEVTVTVDRNSGYYGEKTFVFEIGKRDISKFIYINGVHGDVTSITKVYLDYINLRSEAFNPQTGEQFAVDLTKKFRGLNQTEFSANEPMAAGEFEILVEVEASERYFGSSLFSYVILKRTIKVSQQDLFVTYGNANAFLSPVIDGNISKYSFSFTSTSESGNVIYDRYPTNAGVYLGKIVLADGNYTGETGFNYTVLPAQVSVSWPTYHSLSYGQRLSEAVVNAPGSATVSMQSGTAPADGQFRFADPDAILFAGNRSVEIMFVPDNQNYSVVTSKTTIKIEKEELEIKIRQTEFFYTGLPIDLKIIYAVYPIAPPDGQVNYIIRRNDSTGQQVNDAITAGMYYIEFRIETENYSAYQTAMIRVSAATADVQQSNEPTATGITYGQMLKNSVLSGGIVSYFGKAIPGRFEFFSLNYQPTEVGNVRVSVIFYPNDSVNYAVYTGYEATVSVAKATLELDVFDNEIVYGDQTQQPRFLPKNISIDSQLISYQIDAALEEYLKNPLLEAGTYAGSVEVVSQYYTGRLSFNYFVERRKVNVEFYTDHNKNKIEETYQSTYGQLFAPFMGLKRNGSDGIISTDLANWETLNQIIRIEYIDQKGNVTLVAPKDAGTYTIRARFDSAGLNYLGANEILYTIVPAKVLQENITVKSDTLNRQIYGSVVAPVVNIAPADVKYRLTYNGETLMPQLAGTYNLKIIVDDKNYERAEKNFLFVIHPKEISVVDLKVEDKMYDGVATLKATGTLIGIMLGDEVRLELTATTVGEIAEPGEYAARISKLVLRGRHAGNYVCATPDYPRTVKIIANKVEDKNSGSFVMFLDNRQTDNITVEFKNAVSNQNKENLLSSLLGQKAQVINFSIRTDGIKTDLDSPVRFYIKIPDRFLSAKNLSVEWAGANTGTSLSYDREGDYIVFNASQSGEIVFIVSDFPYGLILVVAGAVVLLMGLFVIFMFEPIKKRRAKMFKMRKDNE